MPWLRLGFDEKVFLTVLEVCGTGHGIKVLHKKKNSSWETGIVKTILVWESTRLEIESKLL